MFVVDLEYFLSDIYTRYCDGVRCGRSWSLYHYQIQQIQRDLIMTLGALAQWRSPAVVPGGGASDGMTGLPRVEAVYSSPLDGQLPTLLSSLALPMFYPSITVMPLPPSVTSLTTAMSAMVVTGGAGNAPIPHGYHLQSDSDMSIGRSFSGGGGGHDGHGHGRAHHHCGGGAGAGTFNFGHPTAMASLQQQQPQLRDDDRDGSSSSFNLCGSQTFDDGGGDMGYSLMGMGSGNDIGTFSVSGSRSGIFGMSRTSAGGGGGGGGGAAGASSLSSSSSSAAGGGEETNITITRLSSSNDDERLASEGLLQMFSRSRSVEQGLGGTPQAPNGGSMMSSPSQMFSSFFSASSSPPSFLLSQPQVNGVSAPSASSALGSGSSATPSSSSSSSAATGNNMMPTGQVVSGITSSGFYFGKSPPQQQPQPQPQQPHQLQHPLLAMMTKSIGTFSHDEGDVGDPCAMSMSMDLDVMSGEDPI